jgi:4-hydroxy-3-methylbut-2-enyl diphosphate reductase IspH
LESIAHRFSEPMARVRLAKNAGFCMGVRRAVDRALDASRKKNGPIYTYGPLLHGRLP